MKKDFLTLRESSPEEIGALLDRAATLKRAVLTEKRAVRTLEGRTVVNLFYENSTRTRCSFELAAKYLGAETVGVSASGSSVQKGEGLIDTAVTLDKMKPDVIVMRHGMSGACEIIARRVSASVVNAGDGMHAHPTQALLDMFTLREHFGALAGLKVAIVGDIKHSRVARSNIVGLSVMGASVRVCAPATLLPVFAPDAPCEVFRSVDEAITDCDAVMGLRIQLERQQKGLFPSAGEYNRFYGINASRMKLAKPHAIIMHPGPVNRGIELSYDVLDTPCCFKDEQVTNGVAVRMALLEALCAGGKKC